MNKVFLIGRLTADPEVRSTSTGKMTASYTLAVDRRVAKDAEKTADFIRCIGWEKKAEFAEKYLHKGVKIAITGRIQTGSYTDKDGKKVYTTDVVVEDQEFCERKEQPPEVYGGASGRPEDGFMPVDGRIDEELPFN